MVKIILMMVAFAFPIVAVGIATHRYWEVNAGLTWFISFTSTAIGFALAFTVYHFRKPKGRWFFDF
jgi:hypothetical protein